MSAIRAAVGVAVLRRRRRRRFVGVEVGHVVAVSRADFVEVAEGATQRRRVRAAIVLEAVLMEEGLHAILHEGNAELRHGGEQVVLNLEIEVGYITAHDISNGVSQTKHVLLKLTQEEKNMFLCVQFTSRVGDNRHFHRTLQRAIICS